MSNWSFGININVMNKYLEIKPTYILIDFFEFLENKNI